MATLVPELYCSNIQASKNFYKTVLGFSILYERQNEGFAYLERQGAELMLDEIGKTRTWLKGPLDLPFGRGINLQIETSNIDALYETIKKSNADIFLDIEEKYYQCGKTNKGQKQFIVCDPDGYMLRFFEEL